jgi:hypothetical protein
VDAEEFVPDLKQSFFISSFFWALIPGDSRSFRSRALFIFVGRFLAFIM